MCSGRTKLACRTVRPRTRASWQSAASLLPLEMACAIPDAAAAPVGSTTAVATFGSSEGYAGCWCGRRADDLPVRKMDTFTIPGLAGSVPECKVRVQICNACYCRVLDAGRKV